MSLKEFICSTFGCTEELNALIAGQKVQIKSDKRQIDDLTGKLKGCSEALINCNNVTDRTLFELKKCQSGLMQLKPKPYQGQHIPADITYGRYMLLAQNNIIFTNIDVRLFITPNYYEIYSSIEKNNLFYDPTKDFDELAPKLYKLAKNTYNYSYASDSQFGFGEVWLFPFELVELRKNQGKSGDCEDWAHLIGSYFACAGLPRDRWWISCGDVRMGGGHSTVYAKDGTETWRHLNSTSPTYSYLSLQDYPSKDDGSDDIGIKPGGFWFSFNDYWSISDFSTQANEKTQSALKTIKIKRNRK